MGVKGLWTWLAPFCERKPLFEIGGETVAIDLSGWVCDSQNVVENHTQPKLYLRNLYFRTCYLLLYDVLPVFVLEGQAPEMKRRVMEARRQLQYGNTRGGGSGRGGDISRRRFKGVLNHCQELLASLGLQCVGGNGEAEAMCAHLNAQKLVSGVISQDSDCFVYGASRIYRNFSVGGAGCGGSVDVYDLNRVRQSMDFGRNKMVALALLCGSDYNGTGVDGVGLTSAVAFLQQHADLDIIPRLLSWSCDVEQYKEWERKVEDTTNCTNCGHGAPLKVHTRQGCPSCATHKGCNAGKYKEWRINMKLELQIRSKALNSPDAFPDPALLNEFLYHEETTPPNFKPSWGKPDLLKFTKLMVKFLGWSECYCLEKFLPLMTRWQLLHPDVVTLEPKTIVKKRNPRGVPCYQVIWSDPKGLYDGLISDDQLVQGEVEVNLEDLWTTVERQDLMAKVYPQLVQEFEDSKVKKKKEKVGRGRKKKTEDKENVLDENNENPDDKTDKIMKGRKRKANGDVSFKTKSTTAKRKVKNVNGSQKTLHSFIKSKGQAINPILQRKSYLFDEDPVNTTAELLKNMSLDLGDDINESDLSNIVDDIVSRNDCMNFNVDDIVLNDRCDIVSSNDEPKRRVSYFFGNLDDNYDAFERSIDLKHVPDVDLNVSKRKSRKSTRKSRIDKCRSPKILSLEERLFGCNSTEDLVSSTPDKSVKVCHRDNDDSCTTPYTPLAERIRRLKNDL